MVQYGLPFRDFYRSGDPNRSGKLIRGTITLLISLLLTPVLVGIVGWMILVGYGLRLLRNVQNGEEHPLPEWGQNREDLERGFRLFVVALVWSIPSVTFSLLVASGTLSEAVGSPLGGLCSLLVALVSPAYSIRMAQDQSTISDGLQFGDLIRWTLDHIGSVLLAVVAYFAVTIGLMLLGLLGVIALGVGLLITMPLAMFVASLYPMHLYGQLAHESDREIK